MIINLSISIYLGFDTYKKVMYRNKLTIEANKYGELKQTYESLKKKVKSIYKVNSQIAQGIIGVKSGSALLLEVNQILPTTIQIESIESKENKFTLKGLAYQPKALTSINSLTLQVKNSFLIDEKTPFLIEAIGNKTDKKDYLKFTLESKFKKHNADILLDNYERLGSYGLAKRVNLLKQEGLIE